MQLKHTQFGSEPENHLLQTPSGADLTFAPQSPRALHANVKSKSSTSNLILLVVLRFRHLHTCLPKRVQMSESDH